MVDSVVTVFREAAGAVRLAAGRDEIGQSMSVVAETEQIADRRNSPLNSRAQFSDGSLRRFLVARRKQLRC